MPTYKLSAYDHENRDTDDLLTFIAPNDKEAAKVFRNHPIKKTYAYQAADIVIHLKKLNKSTGRFRRIAVISVDSPIFWE